MKTEGIKNGSKKLTMFGWSAKLFLFFLLIPTSYAEEFVWGNDDVPFSYFQKESLESSAAGEGDENIQVERKTYEFSELDLFRTIHLTFEENSQFDYLKFRTRETHTLSKALYKRRIYPSSVRSAASFENPEHQVWLIPPEHSFLKQVKHLGNFSILFLIKPHVNNKNMQIFYKTGLFEGNKYGIACHLHEGRVVFQFHNMFWSSDTSLPFFEIKTKDRLSTSHFHKVLLRYSEAQGKLSLFLDSLEQKVVYMTKTEQPDGSQYIARFHPWDQSPLIIGKNFIGALDEMIFSNRLIPKDNDFFSYGVTKKAGPRFDQKFGLLISNVHSMPYSQSLITQFSYLVKEPPGSSVRLYIRFSDHPFPADWPELKLPFREIQPNDAHRSASMNQEPYKIMRNQTNKQTPFISIKKNHLGRGKYFQWKAVLYPDPLGEKTPVLGEVRLHFRKNPPPSAPKNLEVVSAVDGKVTLRFSRNSEFDVLKGGRYHIYYGIRPDEALGVIRYQKIDSGRKVTISDKDQLIIDDLRYQDRIQVTISNQTIYENLIYTKKKPHLRYEYPFLQKNIAYYFWVTVCDNSYDEKIEYFDHESKPSAYIVVRMY